MRCQARCLAQDANTLSRGLSCASAAFAARFPFLKPSQPYGGKPPGRLRVAVFGARARGHVVHLCADFEAARMPGQRPIEAAESLNALAERDIRRWAGRAPALEPSPGPFQA